MVSGEKQSSSDGKLELVSFTEGVKAGIWGKILNKKPHRIAQSKYDSAVCNSIDKGPFLITFKNTGGEDVVHMELDGEYFALERPHSIYIQQSEDFVKGSINMVSLKKKEVKLHGPTPEAELIDFEKRIKALIQSRGSSLKQRHGI